MYICEPVWSLQHYMLTWVASVYQVHLKIATYLYIKILNHFQ